MRFLLSALFIVALAVSSQASSAYWGYRNGSDYLLQRDIVVRNPIANTYQSVTVDFPRAGTTNTKTLSAVYVYDNFANNSGATPSLWSGGPGYRSASVNLKSPVSKGINSTVEFWGK